MKLDVINKHNTQSSSPQIKFPVLTYLYASVEIFDAKYADKSYVIEMKAPIHGNQDHPDFVRYHLDGQPYLTFTHNATAYT